MPIQLHPDCRSRLLEALRPALGVIEVENAMFLNLQTMGRLFQTEEILPKQGPLREELVSYVDDYPPQ